MAKGINTKVAKRLQMAMEAGNLAWWEMHLPSGEVFFDDNKAIMLGYSPKKFKHFQDFVDLVHPEDQPICMDAMQRHLDGKAEVYETEYRIKTKSGKYKWFYDKGRITDKFEDGVIIMGIVENISGRKEAEEELVAANNELTRMNKLMVDRELDMVKLKEKLKKFEKQ